MNQCEKTRREERYQDGIKNPSFSSSLLDEIYRSFDDAVDKRRDLKSHRETKLKKQDKTSGKIQRSFEQEDEHIFPRRALSIDKLRHDKSAEKFRAQRRHSLTDLDRKSQHQREDALFFTSTSNSSDSNSGLYSSSENESLYGSKSLTPSCFRPQRPKPSWTSVSSRQDKTERKKQSALFKKQKEVQMFDDYHCTSSIKQSPKHEKHIINLESMDLNIKHNLRNLKQPISPGARISSFLNSLFSMGRVKKKNKSSTSSIGGNEGKEFNCSSASSFSRSCLRKQSPSSREKMQNSLKRSVRFYPVSVILDEDCRPCGQKSLCEQDDSSPMAFSHKKPWKIVPEKEREFSLKEKSQRVEEAVREYLKEYRLYQEIDHDHEGDAESDSSSDLFELDHIAVMGRERSHQDELPVYETTNATTNLAIANGLII